MCGIMGYVGKKQAMPIILEGLKKLNYRGYDSAGISTLEDMIHVFKDSGDISDLEQVMPNLPGILGIGHTRWATHGGVTKENAHPHLSKNERIAVVHNGVIENYATLRSTLQDEGFNFRSETDSEVIAHLIEKYYKGNLEEATRKAVAKLKGSYAIAVICRDEQGKIVAARNGSPLVVGVGDNEYFAASDIPALLDYTNKVIFLDDYEIATLRSDQVTVMDLKGTKLQKESQMISWSSEDVQKAGYAHYMLKEIHEQPNVIRQATQKRMSEIDGWVYFEELQDHEWFFPQLDRITILASGTSYYAGLAGKYIIERMTRIPVSVQLAVEYEPLALIDEKTLTIAITQSGETADTLTAIRKARSQGSKVLSLCNIPGSSASRISDWTLLGNAGPEIGVAATKTFTSQLTMLYLLGVFIGRRKGKLTANPAMGYLRDIKNVSQHLQVLLSTSAEIQRIACLLKDAESMFYIGRNLNYPIALEGALKIKEIAYVHAEGFSAGELKHGPFALLGPHTPVVALCPQDGFYERMLTTIIEIKARKAPIIAIATDKDRDIEKYTDAVIRIPECSELLTPFINAVACQLLAYHVADIRGCDIDKPRNLAKSVTVE